MCTNTFPGVVVLFVITFFPRIVFAQEIKGDTIYTSTTQQTILNFPSGVTRLVYKDETGSSRFDTIVQNSLVSLRAKIKDARPTVMNIAEGNRRHSFILAYKDELTNDELRYNWSDLKELKNFVAGSNKKTIADGAYSKKQNVIEKGSNPDIISTAATTESGQEDYNDLLMKSYELLEKKDFVEAKKLYDRSNVLKGKKFNENLIKANKFFTIKNYEEAKTTYLLALAIKPEDAFARKRLKETQKKLDDAPKLIADKGENEKITETNNADTIAVAAIKPKQIPIVKKPVEKIKSDTVQKTEPPPIKEVKKENNADDQYDSVVAKATELFNKKAYNEALGYYKQAGLLKPKEDLPPKMIRFVKNVIVHLPEELKRDEEFRHKARIVEIKDLGSQAVLNKDWQTAKQLYSEMLTLNPVKGDEEFARKKIETIDLELQKLASQPVKKEPEVVVVLPKNRKEEREQRILAKRNAILASASPKAIVQQSAEINTSVSPVHTAVDDKSIINVSPVKTSSQDISKISFWTLNQFKTDFATADSAHWLAYPKFSKVSFLQDEDKVEAFYDLNNNLIGTSRNIRAAKLPLNAKKNFLKKYPLFTIKEVIYFDGAEEVAYYISAEQGKEKVIIRVAPDDNYKLQPVKDFVITAEAGNDLKSNTADSTVSNAPDNKSKMIKELMDKAFKEMNRKNRENAKKIYNQVLALQPDNENEELAKNKIALIDLEMKDEDLKQAKTQQQQPAAKKTAVIVPAKKELQKSTEALPVSNNITAVAESEKPATDNDIVIKTQQSTAIPYAREELMNRYPSFNFDVMPADQTYDTGDLRNRPVHYETCKKVLTETPQLNLADSNNNVKLVCQNIIFNGKNAYIKLLIQNKSTTRDFLTGAMQISFLKSNGVLQKLNPRFISGFPVVMPQKEFSIVYVADAFIDVDANDIFYLEMTDRLKKTKLTIIIPGNIYLKQKPL